MFMKKLGVAAALMLCTAGAMASNFRGADQVYLPAAGHLSGSGGTFISDVFLSNLSADPVDVSVIYSEGTGGSQTEYKNVIRLAARERKEYVDFFPTVLQRATGFGQLIFNACLANADCGPATQNADGFSQNFRNVSVESRIFVIPAGTSLADRPETKGQLFSGIPWYHFVSSLQSNTRLDKVFITGIRQTGGTGQPGTFRSNIGLVNASQYSTTTITVRLYQGNNPGDLSGSTALGTFETTLQPLGHTQVNLSSMFTNFGTQGGSNLFVTVEQRNPVPTADAPSTCQQGCPAFLAYGSILDNVSQDATTLEAQYLEPLSGDAINVIYPSGAGKAPIRRSVKR
jgi:hypothetical protein